jgi:hypothetical protein
MSNLADLAPNIAFLAHGAALRRGAVAEIREDGIVRVVFGGQDAQPGAPTLDCEVLEPDRSGRFFSTGDAVLVWLGEGPGVPGEHGIVLGLVGPSAGAAVPIAVAEARAPRPASVVIEAEGELILRNGQARIRLGADGDVEIACNSFATRSRSLLRLLAPLIKLN